MASDVKRPIYTYLSEENYEFVNTLPDLLGESSVVACLNLILDDLRLHQKRAIEIIYTRRR